ncbi:MAG: hypothetical protein HQK53_04545 [Oligoflexia bacterium]|nr:hypothetical protein [Oligoflexia bacterium]
MKKIFTVLLLIMTILLFIIGLYSFSAYESLLIFMPLLLKYSGHTFIYLLIQIIPAILFIVFFSPALFLCLKKRMKMCKTIVLIAIVVIIYMISQNYFFQHLEIKTDNQCPILSVRGITYYLKYVLPQSYSAIAEVYNEECLVAALGKKILYDKNFVNSSVNNPIGYNGIEYAKEIFLFRKLLKEKIGNDGGYYRNLPLVIGYESTYLFDEKEKKISAQINSDQKSKILSQTALALLKANIEQIKFFHKSFLDLQYSNNPFDYLFLPIYKALDQISLTHFMTMANSKLLAITSSLLETSQKMLTNTNTNTNANSSPEDTEYYRKLKEDVTLVKDEWRSIIAVMEKKYSLTFH